MKKKIMVLGATGSVGKNTIEFIRSEKHRFQITALSAHSNKATLQRLAKEFDVTHTALSCESSKDPAFTYHGTKGLLQMIDEVDADIVVNGISGAAGLLPSVHALESGKDLALANKETVVIAGELICELASKKGASILPVDSEHAAIFQLTRFRPHEHIKKIVLTSSGGPFRTAEYKTLLQATADMALRHPTWSMGHKISIDSATLANKGLEVIETVRLFDVRMEDIEVVIHPQSYVHSLIKTTDGSQYAQISEPDMRVPIMNALMYPEIGQQSFAELDLTDKVFEFFKPDYKRFPMLQLAFDVLAHAGSYSIAYNAANEIAVELFLSGDIGFMDIPRIVSRTLEHDWQYKPESFEHVLSIDTRSREVTREIVEHRWF